MLLLAVTLLVRILTDDRSASNSHTSGSFNLSGGIALLLIVVGAALLLSRRGGTVPAFIAILWLCLWTAAAVSTRGASTETLREGVRETSIVGLALIVYNTRSEITVALAARIVQFLAFVPALIALYQLASNTGADIAGELRAYGTFAHPNSAAMFFAIACAASLWRYLDAGRKQTDAVLTALFAAALIATYSIDGLVTLVAMLATYGVLRPGRLGVKSAPIAIACALIVVFFATPIGGQRLARESATNIAAAERGEANTSLAWRLHKWKQLLLEWEQSPIIGGGLGTSITIARVPGNAYIGQPPHNEYVRYLVETGLAGLASLLFGLVILIRRLVHIRVSRGVQEATAATLGTVIIAGCLVNSLADNTFLNSPTCYAATLIVIATLGTPFGAPLQPGVSRTHSEAERRVSS